MLMRIKNIPQITPPIETAKETPKVWARLPASRLPKGIIPAKVNINALITRPRKWSGTRVCNKVLIRLVAITEAHPIKISAISDKR